MLELFSHCSIIFFICTSFRLRLSVGLYIAVGQTGAHAVGRRSFSFDRNLNTTVLYPAALANSVQNPQVISLSQLLVEVAAGAAPQFVPLVKNVQIDMSVTSIEDAPMAGVTDGTFPLVFFMHGDKASHMFSLSLLEHIASHGFVVVASDHPTSAISTWYMGSPIGKGNHSAMLEDIDFLRDQLKNRNGPFGMFLDPVVDVNSYALIGHSRGGLAAAEAGSRNGTVKLTASLLIEPWSWGAKLSPLYESFLLICGTQDPRYTIADCSQSLRDHVNVAPCGQKIGISIQGGDHSIPAAPDTCGFLANPMVSMFVPLLSGFGLDEGIAVCTQSDSKFLSPKNSTAVVKTVVTCALKRAFGMTCVLGSSSSTGEYLVRNSRDQACQDFADGAVSKYGHGCSSSALAGSNVICDMPIDLPINASMPEIVAHASCLSVVGTVFHVLLIVVGHRSLST